MANRLLWLAALLAPWVIVARRICFVWAIDPQYAYGWSVPVLAAALFILRWRGQPPLEPARTGLLIVLAAALLLPLLALQEAAPDWSVANWSLALGAALLTFLFLCRSGGVRWSRWFLFPVLFLLTAVPWPQRFDLWLTQGLMRDVAAITVEILGWFGLPAVREGNLIRLPAGSIGIDEACSGIRSLQAMFMASLFLGELCRLSVARRVAIILAGLVLAFVGNVIRTTLLSIVAGHSGVAAVQSWHDPAGFSILCFGLAGTWFLAGWLRPPHRAQSRPMPPIPTLPAIVPAGILVSLIAVEGAVQSWFRSHESSAPAAHLAFSWPSQERDFHPLSIPDTARLILLYSSGDAATWQDKDGRAWSAYHLVWAPGRTSTQSARMHRPETCLEASGAVLIREYGREDLAIAGGTLPCREYLFQRDGAPLYVLFCLYEQRPADRDAPGMLQDWSAWSRIQRALAGERNLGQESVEIAMSPAVSDAEPLKIMNARAASLVSLVYQ